MASEDNDADVRPASLEALAGSLTDAKSQLPPPN